MKKIDERDRMIINHIEDAENEIRRLRALIDDRRKALLTKAGWQYHDDYFESMYTKGEHVCVTACDAMFYEFDDGELPF